MLSPEDSICESHFKSTFTRDELGRYTVRLPLKLPASSLGDSTLTALRCLTRLRQRFQNDQAYQKRYSDFIQEYKSLNHLEPVSESEIDGFPKYYLPHHVVPREQSRTTKLRVVFNGSSQTSSGVFLNDILFPGPKLQTDISDVLLWFRLHQYVFSTDMVKMYRQIKVHPDDCNLQRIFWHEENQQILSYRLTTVTYDLNCAPFLALRTIQQLMEDEGNRYPLAIPSLSKGRYVDDIFGGAESIPKARKIIDQLIQLCMTGGFPLQKWVSNCPELLVHLPTTSHDPSSPVEIEPSRIKVLGMCWQPTQDIFQFTSWPSTNRTITKRTVLSEIAQLFDPFGLISPITIRAKMFIQELWISKLGWDEPLHPEMQARWESFRKQLPALIKLNIPRWLQISPSCSIELHGFSDASHLAMAAVIYIRVTDNFGKPIVNLVNAKTKVAPLKRLTIPRLELTAAFLLARLVSHVLKALDLPEIPVFLWTDSAVTLTWIFTNPSRWKDFVCNRVTKIQEMVPSATWRFIPGKQNPADCASRGITVDQLAQHSLWWNGPLWLINSHSTWPSGFGGSMNATILEERPGKVLTAVRNTKPLYWDLLERYSSLTRLLRITATCKRAINRFRRIISESAPSSLTPSKLQRSNHFWTQQIQNFYFFHEIEIISQYGQLPKTNSLTRITPFIDRFGLLRVGERLNNSNLDPDSKHPLILPRHSPFTTLVIADAHLRTLHGGTQVTLAYIRQTYWILGGRAPVRSHILRCMRCARFRGIRAQQLMGQLPTSRVTLSRLFLNSGIDFAGPVSIKTWKGRAAKIYKGYLAIFVCLSTSAVHLELVTDYTTEAFIAAYKRFTGRRGICATLRSDCGTNFVGADKALRQRFDSSSNELKELATLLANNGTTWLFNPPSAPHFGGKWEAAVKSTKFHLIRSIGESILTYEELATLLTQIEAILNSRPLSPLSEDSEDCEALSPGHFLVGDALSVIPEPNLFHEPSSRLSIGNNKMAINKTKSGTFLEEVVL